MTGSFQIARKEGNVPLQSQLGDSAAVPAGQRAAKVPTAGEPYEEPLLRRGKAPGRCRYGGGRWFGCLGFPSERAREGPAIGVDRHAALAEPSPVRSEAFPNSI